MKHDLADIYKEALELPPEARAALAGSLLNSLDEEVDEDAEALWEVEILHRIKDIDKGAVKTVPWAVAKQRIASR